MRRLALFLIKVYRFVSGLFPGHCIYVPTCSEYAQQAFSQHSFFKALKLTLFRILRCHPFTKGGFDPVSPVRDRLPKATVSLNIGDISNGVR